MYDWLADNKDDLFSKAEQKMHLNFYLEIIEYKTEQECQNVFATAYVE